MAKQTKTYRPARQVTTTKLKLPDGNTVDVDESLVHVWVSERGGNRVKPYLSSFTQINWKRISKNKGLLTADLLWDPVEENKKKTAKAKADQESKQKEEPEKKHQKPRPMVKLEKTDSKGERTGVFGMFSERAAERMTTVKRSGARWVYAEDKETKEAKAESGDPVTRKRKSKPNS